MVPGGVVQGKKKPLYQGLARRLVRARKAVGIRPTRLSVDAGLARSTVANIEAGAAPKIDIVERLARVLGCSPCWLAFGWEGRIPWREKTPKAERRRDLPELVERPEDEGAEAAEDGPEYAGQEEAPEAELCCARVGERLRQLREAAGLSVRGLGRDSETSDTTVRLTEEGQTVPTVETVELLAKALRCSPCFLAFGDGEGARR